MTLASAPIERHLGDTLCLLNIPDAPLARIILAHGAGAPMDSPFMDCIARFLCNHGLEVVRFEFPYMAKRRLTGSKAPPDRKPILLRTWEAVIAAAAEQEELPLFIGGKSMGGRMATHLAEVEPVKGVVCLGYPFHPRGKLDKLRTEHLLGITTPTLIVQGTRDPLGKPDEVAGYELSTAILMAWMENGDHDLKPLKKTGYTQQDYLVQAADRIAAFVRLVVGEAPTH